MKSQDVLNHHHIETDPTLELGASVNIFKMLPNLFRMRQPEILEKLFFKLVLQTKGGPVHSTLLHCGVAR